VIEYYINELLTEGIYHIPTWAELSMSCASASVEGEMASSSVCDSAAANATSLPVVAGSSGLLRVASSSSTMHLGASARNIAIDSEGTLMMFDIHSSELVLLHLRCEGCYCLTKFINATYTTCCHYFSPVYNRMVIQNYECHYYYNTDDLWLWTLCDSQRVYYVG